MRHTHLGRPSLRAFTDATWPVVCPTQCCRCCLFVVVSGSFCVTTVTSSSVVFLRAFREVFAAEGKRGEGGDEIQAADIYSSVSEWCKVESQNNCKAHTHKRKTTKVSSLLWKGESSLVPPVSALMTNPAGVCAVRALAILLSPVTSIDCGNPHGGREKGRAFSSA